MTTFVLIPGARCGPWHWRLVAGELRGRGHDVVTVDLPCGDDSAGLAEYAQAVTAAVGDRTGVVLVAHSFAGFSAPLVCAHLPVQLLVLVTAMVPAPGETPEGWFASTRCEEIRAEAAAREGRPPDGEAGLYFHDLSPGRAAEAAEHWREQSLTPASQPWPLSAWPSVPTRHLLCRADRLFPAEMLRKVSAERLGFAPDEMDGGHFPMLSRPKDLADRLERYGRSSSLP